MDITTLEKANALNEKIIDYNSALHCFEWHPSKESNPISTNPKIIIEYDGDDRREQIKLPEVLSNAMVELLKSEIKRLRKIAVEEFNNL